MRKLLTVCMTLVLGACAWNRGHTPDYPTPDTAESRRNIYFRFDRAELTPHSENSLRQMFMETAHPTCTNIRLIGHADRHGDDPYNDPLSERRAETVRNVLAPMGFDPARIQVDYVGKRQPLVPGETESADAQNRTVEIYILPRVSWYDHFKCHQDLRNQGK
ncbi:MAG: OmpA family protein [Rickettsiales bacterium]|nr:OmpA family protein [Rickettsiales bacterium]